MKISVLGQDTSPASEIKLSLLRGQIQFITSFFAWMPPLTNNMATKWKAWSGTTKKIKGLSSQMLFDDKGFCYGFNLRAGAVHTSVGAIEMLENAFSVVPKGIKKFLLMDSGYASLEMYNHLITKKVNFAICQSARYLEIRLMDYLLKEVEHLRMILYRLYLEIDKDRLRPFSTE